MHLLPSTIHNQTWLVTGASGLLGSHLVERLVRSGVIVHGICRKPLSSTPCAHQTLTVDLCSQAALANFLDGRRYDVIVHAAGITNVDLCEKAPEVAEQVHVKATSKLAQHAQDTGAHFCYISTDHLWNDPGPFIGEEVPTEPLNVYAQTKFEGELAALHNASNALVVRTNFVGLPRESGRTSFLGWLLDSISANHPINGFNDVWFTPIAVTQLVDHLIATIAEQYSGVFNIAGRTRISKFMFAKSLAEHMGHPHFPITSATVDDIDFLARRPKDMSLCIDKYQQTTGRDLPDLRESLTHLIEKSDQALTIERH